MGRWLEEHREAVLAVSISALVFATILGAVLFTVRRPPLAPIVIRAITPLPTPTRPPTATPGPIQVYVSGAVAQPGVYTLAWNARVEQAITAAGGTAVDADLVQVNLARRLYDEEQIYVPSRGEATTSTARVPTPRKAPTAISRAPARINLNSATLNELDLLPGIGPVLAQRILDYRQANGPFQRIEDIKKVKGIGDSIFGDISELIYAE
jgi:competence protein ComEA